MKPSQLAIAQAVCRYLPPLISGRVGAFLYPQKLAYRDAYQYISHSQTGSLFASSTADLHGFRFAVYGFNFWRAWAVTLAVCSRGDTIIEIGANIGTETVGFVDIVGNAGKVYAFEPLPSNYQALKNLVDLNQYPNLEIFPFAVGDRDENLYFKKPRAAHSSGTGYLATETTADAFRPD